MKLVSFETAVLAKEKGFDKPCRSNYSTDKILHMSKQLITHKSLRSGGYLAPYQYELMDWLREKHGIDIVIHRSFSMSKSYHYCIVVNNDYDNEIQQSCSPNRSYADCLETALQEGLKLI